MKLFFDDENFDGQLQRSVGKADAGMANVGECLAIAAQITGGDRDSWYRAWSAFGLGLVEQADAALAAGHRVSARSAYLRATEYLRQAFFFHRENLDGNELRLAYAASVDAFRKALPLLTIQAEVLTGGLSGYLFAPAGADGPLPTLLHIGGYDGTAEELYASVYPALERGYAFAAVDGPGQGARALRPTDPDAPGLGERRTRNGRRAAGPSRGRPERIVLVGRSFGGVLAPRGASAEHRLAAMIVDPGQYDMGATIVSRLGPLAQRLDDPTADPAFQGMLDNPAMASASRPSHGDQRDADRARLLRRHDPLHNRDTARRDHLPQLRHGQRDRPRLHRAGPVALRPAELPQGVPPVHPGRGSRRALRRHGPHRVLDRGAELAR